MWPRKDFLDMQQLDRVPNSCFKVSNFFPPRNYFGKRVQFQCKLTKAAVGYRGYSVCSSDCVACCFTIVLTVASDLQVGEEWEASFIRGEGQYHEGMLLTLFVGYVQSWLCYNIQSLKTLSSSISKLKEAAKKTVANKGKPETAVQKPAPIRQQQQQRQQRTDELRAKADALRKQVQCVYIHVCCRDSYRIQGGGAKSFFRVIITNAFPSCQIKIVTTII